MGHRLYASLSMSVTTLASVALVAANACADDRTAPVPPTAPSSSPPANTPVLTAPQVRPAATTPIDTSGVAIASTPANEEPGPANSVRLRFETPDASKVWSLRTRSGELLCNLPCARWIGAGSNYYVQKDAARGSATTQIEVPEYLPYPIGSTVDAIPREGGSAFLPIVALSASVITLASGVTMAATYKARVNDTISYYLVSEQVHPTEVKRPPGPTAGIIVTTIGAVGVLAAAAWWVFLFQHGPRLETSPRSSRAGMRSGPIISLTPIGLTLGF